VFQRPTQIGACITVGQHRLPIYISGLLPLRFPNKNRVRIHFPMRATCHANPDKFYLKPLLPYLHFPILLMAWF